MAEAVGPDDCTQTGEPGNNDINGEMSADSVSTAIGVNVSEEADFNRGNMMPESTESNSSNPSVNFKVPSLNTVKLNKSTGQPTNVLTQEKTSVAVNSKQHNSFTTSTAQNRNLSPAQLLQQSEIPIPYKEPSWGGLSEKKYAFEVLKNGTVIDTLDLTTKSFYVFGRLPTCDIAMEHPSLSRHHAVIQFCQKKNDKHDIGWYLYDLDSTHGTWLNKNKIKPRIYYRMRVGYVVKFGGSSRLHVLQGPSEDQEEESELSLTEMKEQRERQKKEIELLRHAEILEMEKKKKALEKVGRDDGCSWGMDDEDANEMDTINPFAIEQPENEDLYIDDPKKSLKGYFEREGLDPPEYEITDMGRGKYQCTVELPVDSITGEPVIAEATVTGKKKEAVVACALEACRILDKMGELRKATHESRKRKLKNWEENDFYDSDEDTFLDRTGEIEKKRQQRMSRLGKSKPKAQTYESIVSELNEVEKEMADIQKKLDEAKAKSAAVEAEEGLDALDAFMANIKSGAMDTKTKMALKSRMFELKQKQMKLQKLANIAKPAVVPMACPKTTLPPSSKAAPMFGKMKGILHKPRIASTTTKPKTSQEENTEFVVEEDEDSEEENTEKNSDKTDSTNSVLSKKTEETGENKEHIDTNKESELNDSVEGIKEKCTSDVQLLSQPQNTGKRKETSDENSESEKSKKVKTINDSLEPSETSDVNTLSSKTADDCPVGKVKGPWLPADEFVPEPKPKSKAMKQKKKKAIPASELSSNDPDYQTWLPPENQSGDGRTPLNEKYGY